MEKFNPNLPDEIIINTPELKINPEGKNYEYEKNGTFYGGDYLPEPPQEINLDTDLPPPPTEINQVI